MQAIFEKSDFIASPFEAFIYDSQNTPLPVNAHWHYFCEVMFFTNGSAIIKDESQSYTVHPGDLVFIHPEFIHGIYGSDNVTFKVLKFDLSLLKSSGSHIQSLPKAILAARKQKEAPIIISQNDWDNYDPEPVFTNCINEINEKHYGYDLLIQAELTDLLTHILRYWNTLGFHPENAKASIPVSNPFHEVVEYIGLNLNQPIKVESLANMCNMSYSYFAKQFHEVYGRSCKDYINLQRINRAKDLLLHTNHDLTYICQETGFADCSHLIRTFKSLEGITPKQFRMQN